MMRAVNHDLVPLQKSLTLARCLYADSRDDSEVIAVAQTALQAMIDRVKTCQLNGDYIQGEQLPQVVSRYYASGKCPMSVKIKEFFRTDDARQQKHKQLTRAFEDCPFAHAQSSYPS